MAKFETCLAFTWRPENDGQPLHTTPSDRGGATAWGITLGSYAAYRRRQGIASTTVADLGAASKAELAAVARADYWDAICGDQLPAGVDLVGGGILLWCQRQSSASCAPGGVCTKPAVRALTTVGLLAGFVLLYLGYAYA